jgi:hypothetical protein
MKDLTEFFLCPACDADLISVILVDFICDNHRRTMVTSGNSNNNIMTAKQREAKISVEILDRIIQKRERNKGDSG